MQPVSTFLKDNNITGDSLDEIVQSMHKNLKYDPDFFAGMVLNSTSGILDRETFFWRFKVLKKRDEDFIYNLYLYTEDKNNPDELRVTAWFAVSQLISG